MTRRVFFLLLIRTFIWKNSSSLVDAKKLGRSKWETTPRVLPASSLQATCRSRGYNERALVRTTKKNTVFSDSFFMAFKRLYWNDLFGVRQCNDRVARQGCNSMTPAQKISALGALYKVSDAGPSRQKQGAVRPLWKEPFARDPTLIELHELVSRVRQHARNYSWRERGMTYSFCRFYQADLDEILSFLQQQVSQKSNHAKGGYSSSKTNSAQVRTHTRQHVVNIDSEAAQEIASLKINLDDVDDVARDVIGSRQHDRSSSTPSSESTDSTVYSNKDIENSSPRDGLYFSVSNPLFSIIRGPLGVLFFIVFLLVSLLSCFVIRFSVCSTSHGDRWAAADVEDIMSSNQSLWKQIYFRAGAASSLISVNKRTTLSVNKNSTENSKPEQRKKDEDIGSDDASTRCSDDETNTPVNNSLIYRSK